MRTIHAATELQLSGRPACLAIGFFDGVHLGHRAIIQDAARSAATAGGAAIVVTFDRHPACVLAPEHAPRLITPLTARVRAIQALGPEALLLLHFDEPLSRVSAEAFIGNLARDLGNIGAISVGANFRFGHHRLGDVRLLEQLGRQHGFAVHGLAAVEWQGQAISSTRVRRCIAAGDLTAAGQMLGRAYTIIGKVGHGDHLGRELGFPTANVDATGLVLPPAGVYAARATVNAASFRAVLSVGHRPTLNRADKELKVEAHLLGFSGDLYGQELELLPGKKLREEVKFPDLAALRAQIERDVAAANALPEA